MAAMDFAMRDMPAMAMVAFPHRAAMHGSESVQSFEERYPGVWIRKKKKRHDMTRSSSATSMDSWCSDLDNLPQPNSLQSTVYEPNPDSLHSTIYEPNPESLQSTIYEPNPESLSSTLYEPNTDSCTLPSPSTDPRGLGEQLLARLEHGSLSRRTVPSPRYSASPKTQASVEDAQYEEHRSKGVSMQNMPPHQTSGSSSSSSAQALHSAYGTPNVVSGTLYPSSSPCQMTLGSQSYSSSSPSSEVSSGTARMRPLPGQSAPFQHGDNQAGDVYAPNRPNAMAVRRLSSGSLATYQQPHHSMPQDLYHHEVQAFQVKPQPQSQQHQHHVLQNMPYRSDFPQPQPSQVKSRTWQGNPYEQRDPLSFKVSSSYPNSVLQPQGQHAPPAAPPKAQQHLVSDPSFLPNGSFTGKYSPPQGSPVQQYPNTQYPNTPTPLAQPSYHCPPQPQRVQSLPPKPTTNLPLQHTQQVRPVQQPQSLPPFPLPPNTPQPPSAPPSATNGSSDSASSAISPETLMACLSLSGGPGAMTGPIDMDMVTVMQKAVASLPSLAQNPDGSPAFVPGQLDLATFTDQQRAALGLLSVIGEKKGDDKAAVDPRKYKTRICRNWEETGICPYEHTCCFAHGPAELRNVAENHKLLASIGYFSNVILLAMTNGQKPALPPHCLYQQPTVFKPPETADELKQCTATLPVGVNFPFQAPLPSALRALKTDQTPEVTGGKRRRRRRGRRHRKKSGAGNAEDGEPEDDDGAEDGAEEGEEGPEEEV